MSFLRIQTLLGPHKQQMKIPTPPHLPFPKIEYNHDHLYQENYLAVSSLSTAFAEKTVAYRTLKCLLESFQKEIFVSGKGKVFSLANTDVHGTETEMVKNYLREQVAHRVSKNLTFSFLLQKNTNSCSGFHT